MGAITPVAASTWQKKITTAAASTTTIIDTVTLTQFRTIHYIVTAYNTVEDKTKTWTMVVTKNGGATKSQITHKSGTINVHLDESVNSGDLETEITNNESYTLNIEIAFLRLGKG